MPEAEIEKKLSRKKISIGTYIIHAVFLYNRNEGNTCSVYEAINIKYVFNKNWIFYLRMYYRPYIIIQFSPLITRWKTAYVCVRCRTRGRNLFSFSRWA